MVELVQVMESTDFSKTKVPSVSPFKGASLLVLRYLFINGNGYSAKIARNCKLTAARVCQVLQELDAKGVVESSSKVMDCAYCTGTGKKNYGTKEAGCIYCAGKGQIKEKTYPVLYRIKTESKPAVSNIFNAIYELNMLQK